MLYIPFFSRLSVSEYQGMLIAALFFIVEKLLRVFLLVFPIGVVVDYAPSWIRPPKLLAGARPEPEEEECFLDDFNSFAEIMEFWGYPYEDHLVETRDGYLLGTHRITGPREEDGRRDSSAKPVVLFWHGFMLNSECFVCHPDWVNILPFRLAEAGYDVWLGNSRGNKYSYKHMRYSPEDRRFWNFSIDEIALVDVPTTVDYILKETGAEKLTYIGFSQGTAQMFMALSRNKRLNEQVDHFIALAPASTPRGFENSVVDYFTKATPHMLYLLFGRRRAMSLVYFWINLLPREAYVAVLDYCVNLLFGWSMRNLSQETKNIVYWHLYSYTSVKAIVHWMQIIRCGELQMYDDEPSVYPMWSASSADRYYRRCGYTMGPLTHWNNTYPLGKITTRVSLFHGGADSLSSVDVLLNDLAVVPEECVCFRHYEHMDFLWADTVGALVYPRVLALMGVNETAANPEGSAADEIPFPEIGNGPEEETGASRSHQHQRTASRNSVKLLGLQHTHVLTRRRMSSSVSSVCSSSLDM
ncbi:alpha/beta-hydrolase [Martensiomyces pterosporus]|nr:alpha/beta-hydrolase [Martensiomyces pterosporus]